MNLQPSTIETIASAIPFGGALFTAREIEGLLSINYSRGTVRIALRTLVSLGRVEVEGDVLQRWYRLAGAVI